MRVLRIGTRRSWLAMAQSRWVAQRLASIGVQSQLIGMDTRGDQILDIPLREAEGQSFFTAELDQALLRGEVDCVVHSCKDLSLDRPQGLEIAAFPPRRIPNDVIVFRGDTPKLLKARQALKIGSSSPRRLTNIPPFLDRALPHQAKVEWVEVRGNVNTRLSRLFEERKNPRALDGVVLALAGLSRLWEDEEARRQMEPLLHGVRWMILPLSECPAAPAQGALAVECRSQDTAVAEALRHLDEPWTRRQIENERMQLKKWGGGCHQRFGSTEIEHPELGALQITRGQSLSGDRIDERRYARPPAPNGPIKAWDGTLEATSKVRLPVGPPFNKGALFVTHSYALAPEWDEAIARQETRLWTAGVQSWFKLAERGLFVEGCADALGYRYVRELMAEPALALPARERWCALTHEGALNSWGELEALATYRVVPEAARDRTLGDSTHFFWTSESQFERHSQSLPARAHHACGAGKTAEQLRARGLEQIAVFASVEDWRVWLN